MRTFGSGSCSGAHTLRLSKPRNGTVWGLHRRSPPQGRVWEGGSPQRGGSLGLLCTHISCAVPGRDGSRVDHFAPLSSTAGCRPATAPELAGEAGHGGVQRRLVQPVGDGWQNGWEAGADGCKTVGVAVGVRRGPLGRDWQSLQVQACPWATDCPVGPQRGTD